MKPIHVLKTSLAEGTYVLHGDTADIGSQQLVVATSGQILKQYDCRQFSHVRDMSGHTDAITDVVCHGSMVVSSQMDTGVMITDLRQQRPAHFLTELQGEGMECNSVSVSPSGNVVGVAAGSNIHLVDTRTWTASRVLKEAHCGDVTRMRHVTEQLIVSGGEDQMINFSDCMVPEKEMLRCAVNCGECLNRITVMPDVGRVGAAGSCETAYLFELPRDPHTEDFPTERTLRRGENFAQYVVDWVSTGGDSYLITGHNSAFDCDDENATAHAQPLSVRQVPPPVAGAQSFELAPVHVDMVRLALTIGQSRLITAGDDGTIAVWSTSRGAPSAGGEANGDEADSFDSGSQTGNGSAGQSDSTGPGRSGRAGRERAHKPRSALPF